MDFTNLKNFLDDMAANHTPGNAVTVYLEGKKVFHYASGYSDLETKTPLTGEEMYHIYSCSKVTTVTAGTQLLEKGKFLLSDPLYEYIPEFREMYIQNEDGSLVKAQNPITVGDLFTMSAGFSYDLTAPGFQKARELTGGKMDTVETIRCVAADPIWYEPGTRWRYSIGHDVLAALISVISGQKFRDYVKENIFDPLDMHETCYHHTPETLARTASRYMYVVGGNKDIDVVEAQKHGSFGKGYFDPRSKEDDRFTLGPEYDSGGAGLISTVSDYAKLMAALGNYGIGATGERILSPYSIDLMRTNRLTPQMRPDWEKDWAPYLSGYGYGLGVATHIDPTKVGSISNPGEFGWGGAAGSTAFADPEIGLGVFFTQHTLNPRESYYQPRLKNAVYSCLK